jgi:hypothetical protein
MYLKFSICYAYRTICSGSHFRIWQFGNVLETSLLFKRAETVRTTENIYRVWNVSFVYTRGSCSCFRQINICQIRAEMHAHVRYKAIAKIFIAEGEMKLLWNFFVIFSTVRFHKVSPSELEMKMRTDGQTDRRTRRTLYAFVPCILREECVTTIECPVSRPYWWE